MPILMFLLLGMSTSISFACDEYYYVDVTTSCGKPAVASGCTTEEIIADTIAWENYLCGQDASLPPG